MKKPFINLSDCIVCEVCTGACPSVFKLNDAGFIEVADLTEYPVADVEEAIKNCPKDCISWEEES